MERFDTIDEHGSWMWFTTFVPDDGQGGIGEGPHVTLLPEMHVKDEAFARELREERWRQDFLLLEGAEMRGARMLGRVYRWASSLLSPRRLWRRRPARRGWPFGAPPRNGVLTSELRDRAGAPIRYLIADLDRAAIRKIRARQPRWARYRDVAWLLGAGMLCVVLALVGRRDTIVKAMGEEPSDTRSAFWQDKLLMRERDACLLRHLSEALEPDKLANAPNGDVPRIGVHFGVAHMPLVAEFLRGRGYRISHRRRVLCYPVKGCTLDPAERGYGHAVQRAMEEKDRWLPAYAVPNLAPQDSGQTTKEILTSLAGRTQRWTLVDDKGEYTARINLTPPPRGSQP